MSSILKTWQYVAKNQGIVVAYPEGIGSSWNGGAACCGQASSNNVDDVGFAKAVVEDIQHKVWIHPARIYAAGFSNGSFLAQRLGCEASEVFSGIVGGAGGVSEADWGLACNPKRKLRTLLFFGTRDISYGALADAAYNFWRSKLGCSMDTTTMYEQGSATCIAHTACSDGATLERCIVTDLGHCWPGAGHFCPDAQATSIDATSYSWEFLQR